MKYTKNIFVMVLTFAVLILLSTYASAFSLKQLTPQNNSVLRPSVLASSNLTFEYNITDIENTSHVFNCSLYLSQNMSNLLINQTNENVLVNETTLHNFTINMSSEHGIFYWKINCTDLNSSLSNETTVQDFIINAKPVWNDSIVNQTVAEDSSLVLNLSEYATDSDGDNLTFNVVSFNSSELNCSINNGSNLTIAPVHNWNGVSQCVISAYDGFEYANETLNINVTAVEDAPVINPIPTQSFEVNKSFTINLSSYAYDPDKEDTINYSISGQPSGVSINSTTGILSGNITSVGTYLITLEVCDNHNNCTERNFTIKIETPPPRNDLVIDNVDALVDGYDEGTISSGDNIKVSPGSNLTFNIKIKNDYSTSSRIYIKDIVLTVTIKDIDNGDDLVEETNEFNLRYDSSTIKTLNFHIPMKVYEGDYSVTFNVTGRDDNGNSEEDHESATVEVEKQDHDVRLIGYSIFPDSVSCDRQVFINGEVMNLGRNDEDDAALIIESKPLSIEKRESFSLEQDPFSDRNSKSFDYSFQVPDDVKSGNYTIILKTYYTGGVLSDYRILNLEVEDCGSSNGNSNSGSSSSAGNNTISNQKNTTTSTIEVVNTNNEEQHYTAVEVGNEKGEGMSPFLITLIVANVVVVILIIVFIIKLLAL